MAALIAVSSALASDTASIDGSFAFRSKIPNRLFGSLAAQILLASLVGVFQFTSVGSLLIFLVGCRLCEFVILASGHRYLDGLKFF